MHIRLLLGGVALLPVVLGTSAMARDNAREFPSAPAAEAAAPGGVSYFTMPQTAPARTFRVAQAADPRLDNLQDTIRKLNGKVEELNFQLLQLADQVRKMQQDNEFRFEQLEKGKTPVSAPDRSQTNSTSGSAADAASGRGGDVAAERRNDRDGRLGAPPRNLGTITLNSQGDAVGSTIGKPIDLLNGGAASAAGRPDQGPAAGKAQLASLPDADNARQLYDDSYQLILSGDYAAAEHGFRTQIKRFPDDPRAADAHFWLGEALLGQDKYRDAAQVFLNANRTYPKSKKAPDMLLKLGIALAAMNQRDMACATYKEVGVRYPRASEALKDRVKEEQSLAGC